MNQQIVPVLNVDDNFYEKVKEIHRNINQLVIQSYSQENFTFGQFVISPPISGKHQAIKELVQSQMNKVKKEKMKEKKTKKATSTQKEKTSQSDKKKKNQLFTTKYLENNDYQMDFLSQIPVSRNLHILFYSKILQKNKCSLILFNPYLLYSINRKWDASIGIELNKLRNIAIAGYQYHLTKNWIISQNISCALDNYTFYNRFQVDYQKLYSIRIERQQKNAIEFKYTKQISNHQTIQVQSQFQINKKFHFTDLFRNKVGNYLSLSYFHNFPSICTKFKIRQFLQRHMYKLQFYLQMTLGKYWHLIINSEFMSSNYTLYIGVKKHKFLIALPVYTQSFNSNCSFSLLIGIGLTLSFALIFLRKKYSKYFILKDDQANLARTKNKIIVNRQNDIEFINKQANINYNNEEQKKGLLIEAAYYGENSQVDEILVSANRENYLYKKKLQQDELIIDVTQSLRFYTHQSQLVLHAKDKKQILGFSKSEKINQLQDKQKKIAIIYTKDNDKKQITAIFTSDQDIIIK